MLSDTSESMPTKPIIGTASYANSRVSGREVEDKGKVDRLTASTSDGWRI